MVKFMSLPRLQIMRSLATVLTIGIFVFDLLTPAASAVGILYLLPMMIYLWNPNRRLTIVVASFATILTVIGALGTPSGDRDLALLNRVLTVFALWFTAVLYLKRVETQASLERSNARMGGVLESAMDAIITIDADQRILLFNPAAEAMFHCPADKAIGRTIDEFLPQRFRKAHEEHVARIRSNPCHEPKDGNPWNGHRSPIRWIRVSCGSVDLSGRCLRK